MSCSNEIGVKTAIAGTHELAARLVIIAQFIFTRVPQKSRGSSTNARHIAEFSVKYTPVGNAAAKATSAAVDASFRVMTLNAAIARKSLRSTTAHAGQRPSDHRSRW